MTTNVNRRALIKGASWAAPAVLASATIPAYAASPTDNLFYWLDGSWDSNYNGRTNGSAGCQTTINISNDKAYDNFSAGFCVGYDDAGSPDTTVHLSSDLKFYYAIPKGYADSFTVTSGPWIYLGKQDISSLPDTQNRPISTAGLDVHVFQWAGSKDEQALAESTMRP